MVDLNNVKTLNNILREIRKNHHKGVKHFYSVYGQKIQSMALRFARSNEIAQNVINDVLINVWRFAQTEKVIENPCAWLYVVTINCIKDIFKCTKNYENLYENFPTSSNEIQEVIDNDAFCSMLKTLSAKEKEIIILKMKWLLTFQDIAELLNEPLSTVSSIYYRAIGKIKKEK